MRKLIQGMRRKQAFTLIELMIVVTIVAILALVAIPLYSQNTIGAIMSEAVSGAGTIKTAERVYLSQKGVYGALSDLISSNLLASTDLNGKYFLQADYAATGGATFLITVTANAGRAGAAKSQTYIVDNTGAETGTWKTGQ